MSKKYNKGKADKSKKLIIFPRNNIDTFSIKQKKNNHPANERNYDASITFLWKKITF